MEYVAGGNMADYILKTILLKFGSFDTRDGLVMEEDEARYFFTQVINAVEYCHQNKVAHRWVWVLTREVCMGGGLSWEVDVLVVGRTGHQRSGVLPQKQGGAQVGG
jgi:hypothetical protein